MIPAPRSRPFPGPTSASRSAPPGPPRWRSAALLLAVCLLAAGLAGCGNSLDERIAQVKSLQESGKQEEAFTQIEVLLKEAPDHPELNYLYGVAQIAKGQGPLAVWPLRKAAEADDPIAPQAGLLLANLLLATEDYEEAVRAADAVLAKEPGKSAALLVRAEANEERKHYEEALADAQQILDVSPDDYLALHTKTKVLAELGRYDEAEESLHHLHELSVSSVPSRAPTTCIGIASFLDEFRKDRPAALAQAEDCVTRYPGEKIVLEWAVWLNDAVGKHHRADELLADATAHAPENLEIWELRAQRLFRAGRYDEARKVLTECAETLDTPAAWNQLVDFEHARGNDAAAIEAVEHGLAAAKDDEGLAFTKADLLISVGRYDEAQAMADKFSEKPFREFVSARIHEAKGEMEEALAAYQRGLELWPNNAQARYNAGMVAQRLGKWDEALAQYREATRSQAEATDAALRMSELLLALGEYKAANEFAMRHAKSRPMDAQLYRIGAIAALKAGQVEDARKIYVELVGESAGLHNEAAVGVALVERETNGHAAAAAAIESAKLDWSDPGTLEALRSLTSDLLADGRAKEALAAVDRSLAAQGDGAELLDLRGRVLIASNRDADASAAFARSLAAKPGYGPALAGQATLAARAGDRAKAIALYDQAGHSAPPDDEALYHAAQLLLEKGDLAAAEQHLREQLRRAPGDALAANDLAWLLAQGKRNLPEALDLAKRAVRIQPDANTWDTLGEVQLANGSPRLAVRAFQKALTESPDAASTRYRLGLALVADDEPARAREAFSRALASGAFPEAEQAKAQLAKLDAPQKETPQ